MLVIIAALVFIVAVVWLHALRPDVAVRTQGLSHYAVGVGSWLITAAFLSLTVGLSGVVADRFRMSGAEIGVMLLGLAAFGLLFVVVAPLPAAPRSCRKAVHTAGALLFFGCAAVGSVLVSPDAASRSAAWLLASSVLLFLLAMGGIPPLFSVRGLLQRLCFALVALWLIVASTLNAGR